LEACNYAVDSAAPGSPLFPYRGQASLWPSPFPALRAFFFFSVGLLARFWMVRLFYLPFVTRRRSILFATPPFPRVRACRRLDFSSFGCYFPREPLPVFFEPLDQVRVMEFSLLLPFWTIVFLQPAFLYSDFPSFPTIDRDIP